MDFDTYLDHELVQLGSNLYGLTQGYVRASPHAQRLIAVRPWYVTASTPTGKPTRERFVAHTSRTTGGAQCLIRWGTGALGHSVGTRANG